MCIYEIINCMTYLAIVLVYVQLMVQVQDLLTVDLFVVVELILKVIVELEVILKQLELLINSLLSVDFNTYAFDFINC